MRGLGIAIGVAWLSGTGAVDPPASFAASVQAQPDNCTTCHLAISSERLSAPAVRFESDVHGELGFSCAACHGGDATVAGLGGMDPDLGFIGVPEPALIPRVCGRCHSDADFMKRYNPSLRVDQEIEYRTSVHGRRLLEDGDVNVATCASCHSAHSIQPASSSLSRVHPLNVAETCGSCHADPEHMAEYGIPIDQKSEYLASIHWEKMSVEGDLSAPTCNDCHGNHGAAPPGIEWVGNVCGNCHPVNDQMYDQSRHSQVFAMMGVPGCASCHNNHRIEPASDEMVGIGDESVCVRCHGKDESGPPARIRALIDSLRLSYAAADSILERAENSGMEVSDALFDLNSAQTKLVSARAAVHSFDVANVAAEVDAGLEVTSSAFERGLEALRDLRFRRIGLAVSVVIILLLISGLLLKIKEMEG
jgi:hypothetical protein